VASAGARPPAWPLSLRLSRAWMVFGALIHGLARGAAAQAPPQAIAAGDNFTWQNHPNQNNGGLTEMITGLAGTGRAFVRWNQATIDSVVGTRMLVSARVDLTIASSSGWAGSGGRLSIHRVSQ